MAKFTLADFEIERTTETFEYEAVDGTVFTFRDPKGIPVTKLLNFELLAPVEVLRLTIADDKLDELLALPEADAYFLEALLKQYMKHFGVGTPGEGGGSPS